MVKGKVTFGLGTVILYKYKNTNLFQQFLDIYYRKRVKNIVKSEENILIFYILKRLNIKGPKSLLIEGLGPKVNVVLFFVIIIIFFC